MSKVKFYHFAPSPPSRGALLTIRNLEIDAEVINVNLFEKEQLQPWFVEVNPQHCVPTLNDDGFVIWESRAISTYLASSRATQGGSSLYPVDVKQRAIVDQRLYFDATTLFPRARNIAFYALFRGETIISEEKKTDLLAAFGLLNQFLDKSKYVAGETPTIADLAILATVSGMVYLGVPMTDFPNVQRWLNHCKSLPGYDENDEGAKTFGNAVKSKLTQGF